MANTKKFVSKSGFLGQNLELLSSDGSQNTVLEQLNNGDVSLSKETKFVNLNADKLDGQEGSYYLAWGNLTGTPTTLSGYGITDGLTLGSTAALAAGVAAAGTASTAARSDHVHPVQTTVSGNAGTATKLETARNINGVAFDGSADITINAVDSTARIASSEKGAANGVATLDGNGKVPAAQLPSYVDDALEFADLASFPATGETGKIYVALDTDKIYRWSGSVYIEISPTAGNSDTATKLATARTLTIGDAGKAFDGSANVSWSLSEIGAVAANTGITAGTGTKITYDAKGLVTSGASLEASDIPNLDWSKITSGTPTTLSGYGITDGLTLGSTAALAAGVAAAGTASTAARSDHVHPVQTAVSGNAGTATALETARTLTIGTTGKAFDGTANVSWTLSEIGAVAANGVITAGTATKITYDAKGLVTGGANLAASDIPSLDWSKITSGLPTTLSGYGITDAAPSSHVGATGAAHGVATTTEAGFMSAADKTKLDGLASGSSTFSSVNVDGVAVIETASVSTTATTIVALASFSATNYTSGKFMIQSVQGTHRHITELLVVHDGTTADAVEYGTVVMGNELFTVNVDVSGGNVRVLITPKSATSTAFKTTYTLIAA